ncbi:hypothetical protein NKH77_11130 [Streptomyces sp. M19]
MLFAAVVAAASAALVAPTAHAADGKYVALGDSYTVAVGTRTYDDPDDACRRGPTAYPRLWAQQHRRSGSWRRPARGRPRPTSSTTRSRRSPPTPRW